MTLISKAAGALSVLSCVHDIHKCALIYSKNSGAEASADSVITKSVKYQKANRLSYKDTQRKNWLAQGNYFASISELLARIGGYIKGFAKTSIRYIPNFIAASVAIFANKNHPKIANSAAVVLGIIEAFDFIKNGVGVGQRNDYLK